MTLRELSGEYWHSAALLQERLAALRTQAAAEGDEERRRRLRGRIRTLEGMRRDTREIAALLEHYYERNVYRNGKYIL